MEKPPEIFDNPRRRAKRDRAAMLMAKNGQGDIFTAHMADEILHRLEWVKRDFSDALVLGNCNPALIRALSDRDIAITHADVSAYQAHIFNGQQMPEDQLDLAYASMDLVISIGVLDSVNDLPGALIQIRQILKPDGLFLAAFTGAGSLPLLKHAMMMGDNGKVRAHIHPQIDVRAAGDLLGRTGFAMPVADEDRLAVRYSALDILLADIRSYGGGNALAGPVAYLGKAGCARVHAAFAEAAADDGKMEETLNFIYLSGWSPSPDQAKPARRGSGAVSLAQALKKK